MRTVQRLSLVRWALALALMTGLCVGCATASAQVKIVEDGQAQAIILLGAEPSESATKAAAELQHYIERISGATLPIVKHGQDVPAELKGKARLLVGASPETAAHKLNIPTGDNRDHTAEGFVLATRGTDVIIAGNEGPLYDGTLYAAYELLEQLGVRWYFPGAFGEVVPGDKSITVPALDLRQTPSFVMRNIWMSGWAANSGDFPQYLLRNKGTERGFFAFPADGSIHRLAPPAKYAESDPQIYAMARDGVRYPMGAAHQTHLTMIDVVEPRALEIAAIEVKNYFRENPEEMSFGFSAPDGNPQSFAPEALAANHDFKTDSGQNDSISDGYFNFVNNLTYEVAKEFPDRQIVVLVYANRVRPPEGLDQPWHKNIIVHLARLRVDTKMPIGDESHYTAMRHKRTIDAWARIASKILIYDYDPHMDLTRMPYWVTPAIASNMKLYKQNKVAGFTTEAHNTWMRTGLNYYIRAKLMWNVDANVDALKAEFYAKFFGPAAKPMATYIDSIEEMTLNSRDRITWTAVIQDWTNILPREQCIALTKQIDEAEALATAEPFKTRVAAYRAQHDYILAWHTTLAQQRAGDYAAARASVEKWAEHAQRMDAIQPGLAPPDPGWVLNEGRGLNSWRTYFESHLQRTNGTLGARIGIAPPKGQFKTDPTNIGLYEQWHINSVAEKTKWDTISLTRDWTMSGYADEQGYGYDGLGWYRFSIDVPANIDPAKGAVKLFTPAVLATQLWVWCNGHLVFSPTSKRDALLDIDVTKWIEPGKPNVFTYRMIGTQDRMEHRGLRDRPLLWQAKAE